MAEQEYPYTYSTGTAYPFQDLRRRNSEFRDDSKLSAAGDNEDKPKEKKKSILRELNEWEFVIAPLIFTALAFFTRIWKIGLSPIVTWDEAHFGKFGSHYIKREFYFDVHPPLGKMLVGLSGVLAGYNGSFEFNSGEKYPSDLNYTFMRIFNSTFGALCVPLAYFTARELNFSRPTVWFVTMMVLFENSYTTISRFILLDSMLLLFTFTTVFCWSKFHKVRHEPFSPEWAMWLMLNGVSIGCVCSVKWIGLFCTAFVGLYTVEDIWNKIGDSKTKMADLLTQFLFRAFSLILIPIAVYIFCFWIHFQVLENSGPGDAQMSSLFQANLRGTNVGKDSPLEIAVGSRVTIKNVGYGGGLLHSHIQTYPEGTTLQQVTCYHHKDSNNDWLVYPVRDQPEYEPDEELRYPGHGDMIRLVHTQTGANLQADSFPAPMTKSDLEVSCYGNGTIGNSKENWIIEVVDDAMSRDHSKIRTLTTSFRLKHADLGCYLQADNVHLPQWGFKQIEVTCTKKNEAHLHSQRWNIENHWNARLPDADPRLYRSPFFRDFVHLNIAMMNSNNALIPDPDKKDDLASEYWQWPLLNVGLRMCSWDDGTVKYFLLGNPFVYWASTASLGIFCILFLWYLIRWQRGYDELQQKDIDQIHYSGLYPLIGWILHYLPFIIMSRVTYVHHYFPALYFAILTLGFCSDWVTIRLPRLVRWGLYSILYVIVIGLFWLFRDISFGMEGSADQWRHLEWFSGWRVAK